MSKVILNDHPFSKDEIEYLTARNQDSIVAQNELDFPPGSDAEDVKEEDAPLKLSEDIFAYVKNLDVETLKSDLTKAGLSVTGEERDLRVALAKHLQEQEDSE